MSNAWGLCAEESESVFVNFLKNYDGSDEDMEAACFYAYAVAAQRHYRKLEAGAKIIYSMMRRRRGVSRSDIRIAFLSLSHAVRVRRYEGSRESVQDRLWAQHYVRHMQNFLSVAKRNGFAIAPPVGSKTAIPRPLDDCVWEI